MNSAPGEHRDNTFLNIPKGMLAMHTSKIQGGLDEAVHFDKIGNALARSGIPFTIEFSADKVTRTLFVPEQYKAKAMEALHRVATGTEEAHDEHHDMRFIRHASRRQAVELMEQVA